MFFPAPNTCETALIIQREMTHDQDCRPHVCGRGQPVVPCFVVAGFHSGICSAALGFSVFGCQVQFQLLFLTPSLAVSAVCPAQPVSAGVKPPSACTQIRVK